MQVAEEHLERLPAGVDDQVVVIAEETPGVNQELVLLCYGEELLLEEVEIGGAVVEGAFQVGAAGGDEDAGGGGRVQGSV